MHFCFLQASLLFVSAFSIPVLVPQPVIRDQSITSQDFRPLALVIQDPLHPDRYRSLSLDPSRNHIQTLDQQNRIIKFGESLSFDVSKALLSPLIAINGRISSAASRLPSYLAANGAALGSIIATPIHLGTLAANNVAAGVAGTLVSVPIALGSGLTAQVIGVVQSGQELTNHKVSEIQQFIQDHAHHIVPPLAAIKGVHAVVQGAAAKTLGIAAQHIGNSLQYVGSALINVAPSVHQFANQINNYALENPGSKDLQSTNNATLDAQKLLSDAVVEDPKLGPDFQSADSNASKGGISPS